MKLSSILSMFMLLTICSANIFGNGTFEDFLKKQPKNAKGVQSHLETLFRTGKCPGCFLEDYDLRGAINNNEGTEIDLSSANCINTNLSGVNMLGANLSFANFSHANLEKANLEYAKAYQTNFSMTNMKKVRMFNAKLQHASLHGAELEEADLRCINAKYLSIHTAILKNANLRCAKLNHAYLENADLENADLSYINAKDARMPYANLSKANLENAKFNYANFEGANLSEAKVNERTSFKGSQCEFTDFRNIKNIDKVNFKKAKLKNSKFNSTFDAMRSYIAPFLGWFSSQ